MGEKTDKRMDRDLKVGGFIMLPISVGLGLFGWFISRVNEDALMPLVGVAVLVACVGCGLLIASKFAERWYQDNGSSGLRDV